MIIVGYEADRTALEEVLPTGLSPHAHNTIQFPEVHPAGRLAPVSPLSITSLLYGDVTFTYSMGRAIHDYLEEGGAL
jgi:hypothetical protein